MQTVNAVAMMGQLLLILLSLNLLLVAGKPDPKVSTTHAPKSTTEAPLVDLEVDSSSVEKDLTEVEQHPIVGESIEFSGGEVGAVVSGDSRASETLEDRAETDAEPQDTEIVESKPVVQKRGEDRKTPDNGSRIALGSEFKMNWSLGSRSDELPSTTMAPSIATGSSRASTEELPKSEPHVVGHSRPFWNLKPKVSTTTDRPHPYLTPLAPYWPTTSKKPATSKAPATSKKPVTSKVPATSKAPATSKKPVTTSRRPVKQEVYEELKDSDRILAVVITKRGGFKGRRINVKAIQKIMDSKLSKEQLAQLDTSKSFTVNGNNTFVFPAGTYVFPNPIRFAGFVSP